MANPPVDLEITQGDTFSLTVEVLNDDGTAVDDWTGDETAVAQIRRVTRDAFVLHEFSTENDPADIVFGDGNNEITFTISADDTALFTFKRAVWDCIITLDDDTKHHFNLSGDVFVTLSVTR